MQQCGARHEQRGRPLRVLQCGRQAGEGEGLGRHPGSEEGLQAREDVAGAIVARHRDQQAQAEDRHRNRHDRPSQDPGAGEQRGLRREGQRGRRRFDAQPVGGRRIDRAEEGEPVLGAEFQKHVGRQGLRAQAGQGLEGIEARIVKDPCIGMRQRPGGNTQQHQHDHARLGEGAAFQW